MIYFRNELDIDLYRIFSQRNKVPAHFIKIVDYVQQEKKQNHLKDNPFLSVAISDKFF